MADSLVYTYFYNMQIICWLQECGLLERGCDLLLHNEPPEYLRRLRQTGRFDGLYQIWGGNGRGWRYLTACRAVEDTLDNPGRPYRAKARYRERFDVGTFFSGAPIGYKRILVCEPHFYIDMPNLYSRAAQDGIPLLSAWEHSVINFRLDKMKFYSPWHYAGTGSLRSGLCGVLHPSGGVREFIMARPELLPEEAKRGKRMIRTPPMSEAGQKFRDEMNRFFDYSEEKRHCFAGKRCIFFPTPLPDENEKQFLGFLGKIAGLVGDDNLLGKVHPVLGGGSCSAGYETFSYSGIPFELCLLNMDAADKRLLVAPYVSTTLLAPKLFFDIEPWVLILDYMYPNSDSFEMRLYRELAGETGRLYRRPEKFLIARNSDEALSFVNAYAEAT